MAASGSGGGELGCLAVGALIVGTAIWALDLSWGDSTTYYPVGCPWLRTVEGCPRSEPQIAFNKSTCTVNRPDSSVVCLTDHPLTKPARFAPCAIIDRKTWTCPGGLESRDGVMVPPMAKMKDVTAPEWWLAKWFHYLPGNSPR